MPYYGDGSNLTGVEDDGARDDIALLGFKVAANGSLARYNLVDQSVDAFEDASGIDASASTNEFRNDAGNYYSGSNTSTDNASNHTTPGSDTWVTPADITGTAKILVVAGGGGSGTRGNSNGGGGAGGLVYVSNFAAVASTTYNLTIGAGAASQASHGAGANDGADSVFDTSDTTQILTAVGGGGGGSNPDDGHDGGSGGGAANGYGIGASNQPADFGSYTGVGFGNNGGSTTSGWSRSAGGGGGAGAVGSNAPSTNNSGDGGVGKDYSSVFGSGVGASGWFAGGGGGGALTSVGAGGTGGGGTGGTGQGAGTSGTANTGGGAGGSDADGDPSAAGGSGAIHILYDTLSYADMTLVSNAQTAESVPTKGDVVMTYSNGAGTATLNTDIKAYVSRDSGSNYTQATLVSQGTTGGHEIVTTHGLDISSQPSGTAMRFKITTHNQSASKDTRVQAVSLGWA